MLEVLGPERSPFFVSMATEKCTLLAIEKCTLFGSWRGGSAATECRDVRWASGERPVNVARDGCDLRAEIGQTLWTQVFDRLRGNHRLGAQAGQLPDHPGVRGVRTAARGLVILAGSGLSPYPC